MKKKHLIPITIELTGIIVVSVGIGLEIAFGGSAYLIMITTGSCLIAVGGVVWGKFMRGGK